ncbi:CapA family protein [Microbulbifer sp. SA54]|uniref:CapA family protein n=1 Tax=Microbulbifer sp. SA54 TaxID=3401577 RepID=UPI003AB0C7FD
MSLSELLSRAHPVVEQELANLPPPYTLFLSVCDGVERARVTHAHGPDLPRLWQQLARQARKILGSAHLNARWLRIDWVTETSPMTWLQLRQRFNNTKRGYFRYGIALDTEHKVAFLEQELNANAMLYGGNQIPHVLVNESRFRAYAQQRFGKKLALDFSDNSPVSMLSTRGIYLDRNTQPQFLYGPGRNAGRRVIDELDETTVYQLIDSSSRYLSTQVKANGRFEYGWHCCFDRAIGTYNTLRHASSTYAMLEAWEVTGDAELRQSIERALNHLTGTLIKTAQLPSGDEAAFLVERNGEIKLGGNAVCLLALVKYSELTGSRQFDTLLEKLALGIRFMQEPDSGKFVHVLQYPELEVKEAFRIIYYDGEAAFGLMRLYGLTKDPRWLQIVENAFEYFIANEHWRANDHWLSYCVNELTLYRPEARYYQFGIQNVNGHLDFILERITTFPTLLELMMAAERMVCRLRQDAQFASLLQPLDLHKFYRALHTRAMYLLNGYYWPEYAMYFQNPRKIVGSFFIRHHAFRVRIDDVEHYLSGFVAFRKYLLQGGRPAEFSPATLPAVQALPSEDYYPTVAWGGDVNLARRQHYRTAELGEEEVIGRIPALSNADLSVVNLECVVATSGEQGVDKGEKSPYYYRARPEMLRLLCRAGIDVVATANNHSGDYGVQALLEQGFWLDGLGIGHAGSGPNREAALAPVVRAAGELNVAIFSIDATQPHFAAGERQPGCAYLRLQEHDVWTETLAPRIHEIRQRAHVVLVAVHWGDNLEPHPGVDEIAVGHRIIDAGADAVLGTSAHILQGIEIYKARPIIHDAGDLLFDSVRKTLKDSGIFRLSLSHRGVERIRFYPVGSGFGFSRQLTGRAAAEASARFASLCSDMGTQLQALDDGSALLSLQPPARELQYLPAARSTRYKQALLQNIERPLHPNWYVSEVPADAKIPPLKRGPLTLLGIRVTPTQVSQRQTLWVESFWCQDEPTSEDLRLNIRAVPITETPMPPWGQAMDHDPCDWQLPTSRWQQGIIYRDFYGLRPPPPGQLKNIDLQLEVGLTGGDIPVAPVPVLDTPIVVRIPRLASAGASDERRPPQYRAHFPAIAAQDHPGQTWNAEQLEAITGGQWLVAPPPGWLVASVVSGRSFIEASRAPVLFVAHASKDRAYHERSAESKYTNWNLHDRLAQIVEEFPGRLAGVIVSSPVDGLPPGLPVLQVPDPIQVIIELGLAARQRYRGDVIAVTGTAGKSSTLKMLSHMLGGPEKVLASLGNYNSRVGAPSMLASLNNEHEAAVVEVAQSALWMKQGPITRRLQPTIALITEIGVSQTTSRVKTTRDTAVWKSRIFDGLSGRAVAIVGEHLQHFDYVLKTARRHAQRVIVFGSSAAAEVQIVAVQGDSTGSMVSVRAGGEDIHFSVPAPSIGMVHNAVAALCAAYAMGRPLAEAARRIAHLQLDEGHLDRFSLPLRDGVATVIDDSWNATVSSMLNAFSVLAQTPVANGGRKIAALGRIVQLGDQAPHLHRGLAQPLLASGVDQVVTHGDEMHHLREALPDALLGPHFSTAKKMAAYLAGEVREDDLVLIKGSRRDSDFGRVAKLLAKQFSDSETV